MRLRIAKKLRVFPNPWGVSPAAVTEKALTARAELVASSKQKLNTVDHSTMDHEGRPCGVFMADPIVDGGEPGRLVGARVCEVNTTINGSNIRKVAGLSAPELRAPRQRTVYQYLECTAHETKPFELADKLSVAEPVMLPFSEYYKNALLSGELIAADQKTASEVGVEFIEPVVLFPKLARAAAQAFNAHYEGEDAYAQFVAERAEAASASVRDERSPDNASKLKKVDRDAAAAVKAEVRKDV